MLRIETRKTYLTDENTDLNKLYAEIKEKGERVIRIVEDEEI